MEPGCAGKKEAGAETGQLPPVLNPSTQAPGFSGSETYCRPRPGGGAREPRTGTRPGPVAGAGLGSADSRELTQPDC